MSMWDIIVVIIVLALALFAWAEAQVQEDARTNRRHARRRSAVDSRHGPRNAVASGCLNTNTGAGQRPGGGGEGEFIIRVEYRPRTAPLSAALLRAEYRPRTVLLRAEYCRLEPRRCRQVACAPMPDTVRQAGASRARGCRIVATIGCLPTGASD